MNVKPAAESAVQLNSVSHSFPSHDASLAPVPTVKNVTLDIAKGEFIAIIGPSGCGKSTLLNMVAGIIKPDHGTVLVNGRPVDGINPGRGVGYMFANDSLFPWRTTWENVALGPELRGDPDRKEKAFELLRLVGLTGAEYKYRTQLSHGMRQRASLARTLAQDPEILLLDEPFGALDAQTKVLVEEEFMRIRDARGMTVLFVTHDLTEAITLADRVVVMSARPTYIKSLVTVPIARPRSLIETRFNKTAQELYLNLWEELRPEVTAQELEKAS
ncbi:ABC transporter ATP-binding protein [Bosea sp. (in: a-proteobacteria)]|uniref:ABC transporter ATP-binding protein n=1 Tax=Bosea sp. (in: a-proteobacteria) TaxID=1871050 RepID=UPI0026022279|nr:ABC transporter ATP-binding protein [Bosea sp. (in: a-proteobacteria)]MCO5089851.1 ABC transporter ATP-binding protein [Bosea sp. (in: a-proteobacteria)]